MSFTVSGTQPMDRRVFAYVKSLLGEVELTEWSLIAYMGDVSIYLVQIDSGKTVRVTLPNIMRDAEHRITRDETVYLSWHGSSPVVLTE